MVKVTISKETHLSSKVNHGKRNWSSESVKNITSRHLPV